MTVRHGDRPGAEPLPPPARAELDQAAVRPARDLPGDERPRPAAPHALPLLRYLPRGMATARANGCAQRPPTRRVLGGTVGSRDAGVHRQEKRADARRGWSGTRPVRTRSAITG